MLVTLGATAALADGGETIALAAKKTAGGVKSWSSGKAVPQHTRQCPTVALSGSDMVGSALKCNDKASGCMAMVLGGPAILWSSGGS